ncbi:hypothetical protein CC78DRAFT_537537 [Lojkania enalia]|uniref:Xylanolytic transcriptional activator regulatory domain-containing protein n=1 Tax=Lojkania enalia TaxID=147567 RepID=A0A9P4JZY7_9PLEO|nr:hypothetical protein CC78DRAFT_537537 [Didymosphaeria enalia]
MGLANRNTTERAEHNQTNTSEIGYYRHAERERLVVGKDGSTRYFAPSIWKRVGNELLELDADAGIEGNDDMHDSSTADTLGAGVNPEGLHIASPSCTLDTSHIFFGVVDKTFNPDSHHPDPDLAVRLWKVFQDNVDPLIKLFHVPTVDKILRDSIPKAQSGLMPKNIKALSFSIYLFAVISLSSEDTLMITGESKDQLSKRYRECCQVSLMQASLLRTSDIIVLQAFVLFLLTMRLIYDARSMWVLSGMAVRTAQRMGLHKDGGSLELTPFQIEMRRRLWWQLVFLDRTTSEIGGAGISAANTDWEAKLPANVDDADLDPDMQTFPKEKEGATEMMYCLIRYEMGSFFKKFRYLDKAKGQFDATWKRVGSSNISLTEKDLAIKEITEHLEAKYLRYCDPIIPLHFLVSVTVRSMLSMLYLVTYHPRNFQGGEGTMPEERTDKLYENALKIIEYNNLLRTSPVIKGFHWNENTFFTWQAFILLLDRLVHSKPEMKIDRAWEQIEKVYRSHPDLITERNSGLHMAVRQLTLKAWNYREHLLREQGRMLSHTPEFISMLKEIPTVGSHRVQKVSNRAPQFGSASVMALESLSEHLPETEFVTPMDASSATQGVSIPDLEVPADWSQWDDLLESVDWQKLDGGGMHNFDFSDVGGTEDFGFQC